MADTYEKDLSAKSSLTTSDFIRVVGSDNVSYKQSVSAVKSAMGIDDIYSKTIPVNLPSSITDLNNITSNSTYLIQGAVPANAPVTTGTYGAYVRTTQRSAALSYQEYWKVANDLEVWARRYLNGAWGNWTKLPTRAEVDALNTPTSANLTAGENITLSNTSSNTAKKVGRVVTVEFSLKASSGVSSNATVANIPSGYRPLREIRNTCYFTDGYARFAIDNTGRIVTYTAIQSGKYILGTVTYII